MKREIYLKEIIEDFCNLKNKIELRSQLNLQDVNIISEYHIQEVLNIVYDLKLTNSNELVKNSKAIDSVSYTHLDVYKRQKLSLLLIYEHYNDSVNGYWSTLYRGLCRYFNHYC